MATSSQYNYGSGQTPDDETQSSAPKPYAPNDAAPTSNQAGARPSPSGSASDASSGQLPSQPAPTFAAQQAAGQARPPAPTSNPGTTQNGSQTFLNGPSGQSTGQLGIGSPGSGLIDLGGGNFAPTSNSGQATQFGTPGSVILPPGYKPPVQGQDFYFPTAQNAPSQAAFNAQNAQNWMPSAQQAMQVGLAGTSAGSFMPSANNVYQAGAGGSVAPVGQTTTLGYDPNVGPASGGSGYGQNLPPIGAGDAAPQGGAGGTLPVAPGGSTDASGQTPQGSSSLPSNGSASGPTSSASGGAQGQGGGSSYDLLNGIVNGAAGNGAGSQTQAATQAAVQNMLNNPDPYHQQDLQNFYNYAAGNIDDQYALQRQAIDQNMAARGLGTSSIHAGNLENLNIGQRSALSQLANDQAQNYANTIGQYQANAVGLGNQVGNSAQQNQQGWFNQLMNYGQNAFNNDATTQALNNQQQQAYQNYILGMTNLGYNG